MKLLQTAVIILISSSSILAQEHIIGIRGGSVKSFNGNEPLKHETYQTIEKGVYYRYNTKGRLSLDIGLAYHNYKEQKGPSAILDAGVSIYESKYVVDIIDFQYSLQYNITPKSFRNLAVFKNINNYIGIVLAHRSGLETDTWYTEDNHTRAKGEIKIGELDIEGMAGLNYTISYNINRLVVQSTSTILIGTGDFGKYYSNNSNYPSSRLSINLGIGYNLKKNKQ